MKVLVGVNVLHDVDNSVYISHCQEWFRMGKDFPDAEFILFAPPRMSIDNMRNTAAKLAMEHECDYLYFIDDDMILTPSTLKSLVEADKDVAMAYTFQRGYPFAVMAFKSIMDDGKTIQGLQNIPKEELEEKTDANGLCEVQAIGCACVLIKVSLLKKLEAPHFVTVPGHMTEDVYFCLKAKNILGMDNVSIVVDTKVPTGHLCEKQVLNIVTRDRMKFRAEEDFPQLKEDAQKKHDRGIEYLNSIKESIKVDMEPEVLMKQEALVGE